MDATTRREPRSVAITIIDSSVVQRDASPEDIWSSQDCIITIWKGETATLEDARQQFAERIAASEKISFRAAGILLQLLLGTLDEAISRVDERILTLHEQVKNHPESINFADLSRGLEILRTVWLKLGRYANSVRSAAVGVEDIAGMNQRGPRELNDYAERANAVANTFSERFQWGVDVLQSYSAAIAQCRSEQINRLTAVSIVFLPTTFLTWYFGMNFAWMADRFGTGGWFLVFGVLLPLACARLSIVWLRLRGLL